MDIKEIETKLESDDMHDRLNALKALKGYQGEIAMPLLLKVSKDEKFLVRSFVAMGLGKNKTAESFATLLEMVKLDRDTNVRAEACNSLSLFGEVSIPHLQQAFYQDDNWLVRLSILAVLTEFNCPEELFDICVCGIKGDDNGVQENSLSCLASLVNTSKEKEALALLLSMKDNTSWRIRLRVAQSLTKFNHSSAKDALSQLTTDEDYRVVAVALESSNT